MRPNIVLAITHDTGRHISPYGIETADTPHCERLAAESVLFENSFCTAPQCSPSRASIVTGRFPHANGVMGLTHEDFAWEIKPTERTIAMLLGEAGYETLLLGYQHETRDPDALGFDTLDLAPGFSLMDAPDGLDRFLAGRDGSKPFYAQIGCWETHLPWGRWGKPDKTLPDTAKGLSVPPYLKDGPETRKELAQFQGCVKRYDTALGRLLDFLEKRGLVENTILVATTDHGAALPRAKGTLYDAGLGTFLFMRYPGGGWPAGTRRRELVSHVDILPTLLESCGIGVPMAVQGRSFLPLLAGGPYRPNESVFGEKTFHECYDPMRCVRTDRYKYICYFEKSTMYRVPGDIMAYGAFAEWGPTTRREQREGLYDLENDPYEMDNRADDPALASVLRELRRRLLRWMRDTRDPLLDGPVASPYYYETLKTLSE